METNPPDPECQDSFESFPLTRPEYISAMVHFYRGEMHRSQVWRTRLDTTTNWAVVTTAGLISVAFSSPDNNAFTLMLGNLLITNFLLIEARRYRYFCVYRARVRMIEENFYLPLIRRKLLSPRGDWRESIAQDLDSPKFKTTRWEAILFRLRRNYVWLYWTILATWVGKLFIHPTPASGIAEAYSRVGLGIIPPWAVLGIVGLFYAATIIPLFSATAHRAALDEVHGFERDRKHWTV